MPNAIKYCPTDRLEIPSVILRFIEKNGRSIPLEMTRGRDTDAAAIEIRSSNSELNGTLIWAGYTVPDDFRRRGERR